MDLKVLMEKCWADDPSERPTFESVKKELEGIVKNSGRHSTRAPAANSTKLSAAKSSKGIENAKGVSTPNLLSAVWRG